MIVGAIIGIIYLVAITAAGIGIWERGVGAKVYLTTVTIAVAIALFVAWHRPEDDVLSIALGIVFTLALGLTAALLGWAAFSSLGIIGDGGFASEFARSIRDDSDYQVRKKLHDMEVEVGDILKFGKLNGKEFGKADGSPIYWRVLDVQDNRAFLLAEQYVGRMAYQHDAGNIGVTSAHPWVGANDLRAWLNDDFLKSAFDDDERARLSLSDENDYVSCLSTEEAERFFKSAEERRIGYIYEQRQNRLAGMKSELESLGDEGNLLGKAKAAKRKKELQQAIKHENESGGWWLRPTGSMILQKRIPYVSSDGSINYEGKHAAGTMYVRPSIWIITKFE
ncbi:DUF6273 domain-containing protein [Slackia heliotrinireducens]|uniref:DUF6273 domain-containing protein n=1 Tax=Slackia heliotrinireducens TaxID=84110 RepID=UPI00331598FC